jgi:glycosyltransferase involved in cell wall biosynthesis
VRILVIISTLDGGGAERATANLARLWVQRGDDVTVAALKSARSSYPIEPPAQVISLGLAGASRNLWEGVTSNVQRVRAIRRLMRDLNPDVTLGMMTTASVLVAFAGFGLRSRTFGAERTYPPHTMGGRFWKSLRNVAYGLLDGVAAQTDAASDWLRHHTRARRVFTIPNAVEYPLSDSGQSIAPTSVVPDNQSIAIAVGRLAPEKDFDTLIRAFAATTKQRVGWSLVILGDGPDRTALKALVSALGAEDRIFLPGWAGNIAEWHKRASFFVLSSRFEGFPNALLEAMASGLPVVSFDCEAGPRDMIDPDENGILIPPRDENALAGALRRLMDDPVLRRNLGTEAVKVRSRFSYEHILTLWDAMFALTNRNTTD